MEPKVEIARQIWEVFAEPTPPKRLRYYQFLDTLPANGEKPIRFFSEFIQAHLQASSVISTSFFDLVQQAPNEIDGLQAVIDEYRQLEGQTNPDLLYHALSIFITHYKSGITLQIPSILVTDPELVVPSDAAGKSLRLAVAVGSPAETKMDWFREDPLLNEHHAHWHLVYDGSPSLSRQGEMFFYMHRQMLARYNVERMALAIPIVKSYNDFTQPIVVGYTAGPDVRLGRAFEARQPNAVLLDPTGSIRSRKRNALDAVQNDINTGVFDVASNQHQEEIRQVDQLGAWIEPNGTVDSLKRKYGNYHGSGHITISDFDGNGRRGVMSRTTTAIRDVIFWEWHQSIDDIYQLWQKRLIPYKFADDAPKVLLRKSVDAAGKRYSPDIILCLASQLPAGIETSQLATALFGTTNWNQDYRSGPATATVNGQAVTVQTVDTIQTRMETGSVQYIDGNQTRTYPFSSVNHDEFCYCIRIENRNLVQTKVTVRIFLAPEAQVEERRMWIELDKFLQDLKPLEKKVVFRRDTLSSVVRKPAVKHPATANMVFDPTNIDLKSECDCGYPYHMLIPRGTPLGMEFRLMVMVTDAQIDLVGAEPECGSLSFCGTRDQAYPDRRPLGYPFNRPFAPAPGIDGTLASNDNMASRIIQIKWQTQV